MKEQLGEPLTSDVAPDSPSVRPRATSKASLPRSRSNSIIFSGKPYRKVEYGLPPCAEEEKDPEAAVTPTEDDDADEPPQGTVFSSVITLTTTAAGAGILTLPYALKDAGFVGGMCTLAISAVVSDYAMIQLVRSSSRCGARSYREVGVKLWGEWMGTVVDVCTLALLIGASVVFLIIMADEKAGFPAIFSRWVSEDSILAKRVAVLAIAIGAMYPLTLLTSLHALRYTSLLALAGLAYVFIYLLYFFIENGVTNNPINYGFRFGESFWVAVPMQATAYCAHFNVIPLANELQEAEVSKEQRMSWVIHVSILGILLTLYAIFSVVSYLSFGSETEDNILSSKFSDSGNNNAVLIGRLCIAVVMGLKFPLISLPFRDLFNEVVLPDCIKQEGRVSLKFVALEMLIFCGLVFVAGWQLQSLQTALGILGATAGNMLSFVLPGLFGYKCAESRFEKGCNIAMVAFGTITGVAGAVTGVLTA